MVLVVPPQIHVPNYGELVSFLIKPFLSTPNSLSVDCEPANRKQRVWVRVAVQEEDKGHIFGRGGRNLNAIRTILEIAAARVGQTVYLDVYESDRDRSSSYTSRKRQPYDNSREPEKFQRRRSRPRYSADQKFSL
jgi:predicted RNA-binding protein YlqC (UPF0109 family)